MRSRASGGTCGDSVAAASAATMSSLRRRAIWVQRAMSTERSSIGGRPRARTTAAASEASARSRSHAMALARDRGHDHDDVSGVDALARDQALDVGGDRLCLGAIVGAAPKLEL